MTAVPTDDSVTVPPETVGAAQIAFEPLAPGPRFYAIFMLQMTMLLSLLDRQVLNILAEPIKHDLHIADWQIGALSGLAFAVFYTVFGIPIARLAEWGHRPRIIGAALAIWSAFTALSGFAGGFATLALARMGVGVGEAGCSPPGQSLIADYTPREQRASALAFFHMGSPMGSLLGLIIGGLVADALGWRWAFFVVGIPGLIFALLIAFTLPEPRRNLKPPSGVGLGEVWRVLRTLSAKPTFWLLALGTATNLFVILGHGPFTASFFFRVHGAELHTLAARFGLKSAGFLGLALGLTGGTVGVFSTWLGGRLGDRLGRQDPRGYVAIPAIASIVGLPLYFWALSVPDVPTAIGLMTIASIVGSFWYGPTYAALMGIVPSQMRATATAIFLFIINLIGLGLGPLAVGALSDVLAGGFHMGAGQGVRWALMISSGVSFLTFALLWGARRTIRNDTIS